MEKLSVSIVGVTGYTGLELLRILRKHPQVELRYLVSRESSHDDFPSLLFADQQLCDIPLHTVAADSDVVFLALPHTHAQRAVAEIYGQTKIVDLSGDFRLRDSMAYERYYKVEHEYPDYLDSFVYGLPESYREQIRKADYVANPGCFALVCQLVLLPLSGMIDQVDIFALTGSTGSGKTPSATTHHPIRNHNVSSYKICDHRHMPEILQTLALDIRQLRFVPTSGPFSRGILANAFIEPKKSTSLDKIKAVFADFYQSHPFVRIVDKVELAHVVGANFCHISYHMGEGNRIIVQGAIDNLIKGAAGNAVQNMNLMFGFAEDSGLDLDVYFP